MKTPYFSVFIPIYNGEKTVKNTINSILNQSFSDFEIVIRDNHSTDNSVKLISEIKDKRIKIKKNKLNIGYPGNLKKLFSDCKSNNVIIMAADDLLDKNALKWYHSAFQKYPKAGGITRPYYWFNEDYRQPVRIKKSTDKLKDILIWSNSKFKDIKLFLSSIDQCSGLCIKKDLTKQRFDSDVWVSHGYPILDILKRHPIIFLNKYPLAVRIGQSATRTNIYQNSPMLSWKKMIDTVYFEKKYLRLKQKILLDFISTNYIGLVQIKNFGSFKSYIREVYYLIKFRPQNLIEYKFWIIFLITLLIPAKILIIITDNYKQIFLSKLINQEVLIDL